MYRIRYDPEGNILHFSIKGFWKPDTVAAFAGEVYAASRSILQQRDEFVALCESFDFPVQSIEVSELLAAIMKTGTALNKGRAAIVVGSALNKLQAERTLDHPRVKVFTAMEEAQQWLLDSRAKPQ